MNRIFLAAIFLSFIGSAASATCPPGSRQDPRTKMCVKRASCSPCPPGFYFRPHHKDCTKCDPDYPKYDKRTKTCR